MNFSILLLLLLPIAGAAFVFFVNDKKAPKEAAIMGGAGLLLSLVVYGTGYMSQVADFEVLNGKVLSKSRRQDTYEESYSCNCTTTRRSDGSTSTSCDTCHRTHYTVDWDCSTTIGEFKIDSKDSLSRHVYETPDPNRFTIIQPDDPVAKKSPYVNYVQAVPESLFSNVDANLMTSFSALLPEEPSIYDIYRIDRFITPGFSFADANQWNLDIGNMLRDLGPQKQVNFSVVIAKTTDRNYTDALRVKWDGANKNDVVLVIGSTDGQKIEFADIISWTKNELFKIEFKSRVTELGIISRPEIMKIASSQISKNFERRHMKEFEYLKGEVDLPTWVVLLYASILSAIYGIGGLHIKGKNPFKRMSFRPRRW